MDISQEKLKRGDLIVIVFKVEDLTVVQLQHFDVIILIANIGGVEVRRLLVNNGSSCGIVP